MGIFEKAWMGSDVSKAMEYVEKTSNERVLARICSETPHTQVRLAAASKISSPQWLINCASASDEETLRILSRAAKDDETLCGMLLASSVRGSAAEEIYERITDQNLLLKIALSGRYRLRSARRITDPALLETMAEEMLSKGGDSVFRAGSLAAEKSGQDHLIYRYAMKSAELSQWNLRKASFTRLMNTPVYNAELSKHLRNLEIDHARENIARAVKEHA